MLKSNIIYLLKHLRWKKKTTEQNKITRIFHYVKHSNMVKLKPTFFYCKPETHEIILSRNPVNRIDVLLHRNGISVFLLTGYLFVFVSLHKLCRKKNRHIVRNINNDNDKDYTYVSKLNTEVIRECACVHGELLSCIF